MQHADRTNRVVHIPPHYFLSDSQEPSARGRRPKRRRGAGRSRFALRHRSRTSQ